MHATSALIFFGSVLATLALPLEQRAISDEVYNDLVFCQLQRCYLC